MSKRKIILNLAMSLDGYIAREDGSFDWIAGDESKLKDTKNQFDFTNFLNSIDVVIMGRTAYEDLPEESFSMYDDKKVYVLTSKVLESRLKNVEFVNKDILNLVKKIQKEKSKKNIWIYGGSKLADIFLKSNIIDEYIIGIIPIILGSGKKLFFDGNPTIKLKLKEFSSQEGILIMTYVKR